MPSPLRATACGSTHCSTRSSWTQGTPGLHALMERRGYTAESYVRAMREYPRFWTSIRPNTRRANASAREIEASIGRLRALYPSLRPAPIYFTVGALMTGGTTLDSLVLIGSEIALGDHTVVTEELPVRLAASLRAYFDTDPVDDLAFLSVHEYVHTQQGPFGADLLAVSLQEGVAEFVAALANGQPSPTPAVAFGEANAARIRDRFATEMFSPHWNDWLYNDFENEFGVRDLGYAVGYAIADRLYERSADKALALARLIEVDYQDTAEVDALAEPSRYFPRPVDSLRADYERERPRLLEIAEFENGALGVDPATRRMTLTFSAPLNPRFRGFDYGPLGEDHVLRITRFVGMSPDRRIVTVDIDLRPTHRHQLTLTSQFRDDAGRTLAPTVIDLTTGAAQERESAE